MNRMPLDNVIPSWSDVLEVAQSLELWVECAQVGQDDLVNDFDYISGNIGSLCRAIDGLSVGVCELTSGGLTCLRV